MSAASWATEDRAAVAEVEAAMKADASSSGAAIAPGRVSAPTLQELPRLHQELAIWMAHTQYKLQPIDERPVWRVQNTSMTVSCGSGIGVYYLGRHLRPKMSVPLSFLAPAVTFYLTYRAAQAAQMPGMYESILKIQSPLGDSARRVLCALREGGKLPSQEYGTKMPSRGNANSASSSTAARGDVPDAGMRAASQGRTDDESSLPHPLPHAQDADTNSHVKPGGADLWGPAQSFGESWDTSGAGDGAAGSVPKRRTWEEIRAQSRKTE